MFKLYPAQVVLIVSAITFSAYALDSFTENNLLHKEFFTADQTSSEYGLAGINLLEKLMLPGAKSVVLSNYRDTMVTQENTYTSLFNTKVPPIERDITKIMPTLGVSHIYLIKMGNINAVPYVPISLTWNFWHF